MLTNKLKQSKQIMSGKSLSIVIPAFNEELVLKETIKRIKNVLTKAKISHEIIIVNDGSTDNTLQLCFAIQQEYGIRVINLSRNYGHMAAITAGLESSHGNFIATMDADLQDPAEDLVPMFKIITKTRNHRVSQAIDVVQAFRSDRVNDTWFKRTTAHSYYKIIKRLTGIELIPHAADFRIITREVANVLIELPERNRIYRLLIPKLGVNIQPYPIVRAKRYAGVTKYSTLKMIELFLDSVFAFSNKPLKIFSIFGFFSSLFLISASSITFLLSMVVATVPGWLSLVLLLLGINAFLFSGLGLLGEYTGRIYELVQARPIVKWHEVKNQEKSRTIGS
jgi:dolichol-phosphate mannosyltransferase